MPVYTQPVWGEPQEAVTPCSSIVTSGVVPSIMTGILTQLLKYHFHDPLNIVNPIWRNSKSDTDNDCNAGHNNGTGSSDSSFIWIGPGYSGDRNVVQTTPGIFISPGGMNTQEVSQKNINATGANTQGQGVDVYPGRKHNMNFDGVHNILCKARNGASAMALGEEVFMRMLHYQTVIRDDFRLGKFHVRSLSDIKEMAKNQEADEAFYTIVRIEWALVYRWLIRKEEPLIKRTNLLYQVC